MAYSGKYKVINRAKYDGNPNTVVYRSRWEYFAFKWCDTDGRVKRWSSEEVVVPYVYQVDDRIHSYYVDLFIEYTNGTKKLVEIKPHSQTQPPQGKRRTKKLIQEAATFVKNQDKWAAADAYARKKGWKFEVWTEHHLTKMGILPKGTTRPPSKMKPMKRMPAMRKARKNKPK